MSALGQKQTPALQKAMSALPPKADVCGANRHVCFGPKADIGAHSITSSAMASSATGYRRAQGRSAPTFVLAIGQM
jgi:hypothetical protein